MDILTVFRALVPAYAEKNDGEIIALYETLRPQINRKRLGNLYWQAAAYLVAHNFAWGELIAAEGAAAGAAATGRVVSEKEGDLSRTYEAGTSAGGLDSLERTAYGQEYKRILRMKIFPALTRRG
jgi:hypothetical protein